MAARKSNEGNNEKAPVDSVLAKRLANLKPWKPGKSGNPKGRRKGQRDYRTLFWIALENIARSQNMTAEQVEEALHAAGIVKAIKGDFYFHQEILNRVYGKPKESMEITGKLSIADLIATAHGERKRGTKSPR